MPQYTPDRKFLMFRLGLLIVSGVCASLYIGSAHAQCAGGTNGTAKTTTYLTQNEFQDGRPPGSITPGCMRDLIASGPQWDAVAGSPAPYVSAGEENVAAYFVSQGGALGSGQSSGQRATNCTALQAAINYGVTNKLLMKWYGTYEISCAAGIVVASGGAAFAIKGSVSGTSLTQFYNTGTGAPILTIGDATGTNPLFNAEFDGISLFYGSTQTSTQTNANALVFGSIAFSDIRNINIAAANATVLPYRGLYLPAGPSSTNEFFSNTVVNILVQGFQDRAFDFEAQGTGNYWQNIYLANIVSGAATQSIDTPFYISASSFITEQVFDRLNIEHTGAGGMIEIHEASAQFNGMHIEDDTLGTIGGGANSGPVGNGPILVLSVGADLTFTSPTIENIGVNTANHTGIVKLFSTYGGGTLKIQSPLIWQSGGQPTQNETVQFTSAEGGQSPTFQETPISIDNAVIAGWDSFPINMDATLTAAVTGDLQNIDGYRAPTTYPRSRSSLIDNPANNFVVVGGVGEETTIVYNAPLTANLTLVLGMNYMTSGNGSATKRPVGHTVRVVRTTAATGAFTITVKDSTTGGTTIGTFSTTSAGTAQVFGENGTAWSATF